MYISINKEWFLENKDKLEGNSDEKGCYVIETENIEAELGELNEGNKMWIKETDDNVFVSLDYTPETETVVSLVENAIDDIKGDALVSIIEMVVKKLNKFKSLIESVRGL
ncbi:MAG: hypothetical protein ACE5RJ_06110 [Nitrosopumilaceae archaeon]